MNYKKKKPKTYTQMQFHLVSYLTLEQNLKAQQMILFIRKVIWITVVIFI